MNYNYSNQSQDQVSIGLLDHDALFSQIGLGSEGPSDYKPLQSQRNTHNTFGENMPIKRTRDGLGTTKSQGVSDQKVKDQNTMQNSNIFKTSLPVSSPQQTAGFSDNNTFQNSPNRQNFQYAPTNTINHPTQVIRAHPVEQHQQAQVRGRGKDQKNKITSIAELLSRRSRSRSSSRASLTNQSLENTANIHGFSIDSQPAIDNKIRKYQDSQPVKNDNHKDNQHNPSSSFNPYPSTRVEEGASLIIPRPGMGSMQELSSIDATASQERTLNDLMKVSIDMGNGHHETILIRDGESPTAIAKTFARKYSLPESTEFLLKEQIEQGQASLQQNNSMIAKKNEQNLQPQNMYDSHDVSFEEDESHPITSNINSMDARQWNAQNFPAADHQELMIAKKDYLQNNKTPIFVAEEDEDAVEEDESFSSQVSQLHQREPLTAGQRYNLKHGNYQYEQNCTQAGHRLYVKGMQSISDKENLRQQLLARKEEEELEGATFRPDLISQTNRFEDTQGSVRERGGIKTEDFLIFYGKVAAERRLKLQQDLLMGLLFNG